MELRDLMLSSRAFPSLPRSSKRGLQHQLLLAKALRTIATQGARLDTGHDPLAKAFRLIALVCLLFERLIARAGVTRQPALTVSIRTALVAKDEVTILGPTGAVSTRFVRVRAKLLADMHAALLRITGVECTRQPIVARHHRAEAL